MAGSLITVFCSLLLCTAFSAESPMRQKRGSWEEQWADFFQSEAALTQKSADNSNAPVLKANANDTLVEIRCQYSVHNTRKCTVPVKCQNPKKNNCTELVEGAMTKYDGITKYYQECIFTQWFADCMHYKNGTYACRKAWQGESDPKKQWGLYAGDVYSGFYAIDEKTAQRKITLPGQRKRPDRPQAPLEAQKARRRDRRELHGTC